MSITLESLAAQCKRILAAGDTPDNRERAAAVLAQALRDEAFLDQQFAGRVPERKIVYEDPDLGFCILVHEYPGARERGPHDHGPSWAIYGQATGETVMSEFETIEPASSGRPGRVREVRSYAMRPGDVHVYNEGAIHSPRQSGPTRLVRIEGCNLEKVSRASYVPV